MRQYPSIDGPSQAPKMPCLAFYKHDGSNLRFEWSRKRGFHKFGTKTQLFDASHETYGSSVEIFQNKYAEAIEKIVLDNKQWRNAKYVTAFAEYFGDKSFAGIHEAGDPKKLVLFDIQVDKRGIIGPREFLKTFGHLEIPRLIYEGNLNTSFIEEVRQSLPGDGKLDLNEGVVCKGGSGHELWMRKVKTHDYLRRLKERYSENWSDFWE